MQEDTINSVSEGERNLTWEDATKEILERFGPLHYEEITKKIIEEGLRRKVGATPAQSVNSAITSSINFRDDESPFVRVERGVYDIREKGKIRKEVESEEQIYSNLIGALGMYWSRKDVLWTTSTTKLLGEQQRGAEPVDFSDQIGVYILYDQNKLVYVGQTTDQTLGRRLSDHTRDRLKTRWDRFSWFGLKGVNEEGNLTGPGAEVRYSVSSLISGLEALLIEACEPIQNRKRGDSFNVLEYNQVKDTNIMDPVIAGIKGMLENYSR